jgi:hypothetical protein
MIKQRYKEWITKYNQKHKRVYGLCAQATLEMAAAFPELQRVRGFAHDGLNGKPSEHWWLKDGDNTIIDPTGKQFLCIVEYEEWDEEREEPTGKCLNCGAYCYHGQHSCTEECAEEFAASLRR